MVFGRRFQPRGGFGHTGRFFGPGELRMAILALLGEEPAHGYELITRLEERTGGVYRPSAGAIYPTLQLLEDERLVRAVEREGRRTYEVRADGRALLKAHAADLDALWNRASARSEWGMFRDPDAAEILRPALRLAKAAIQAIASARGDAETVDRIRKVFVDARLAIEQLARRKHR